MTLCTVLPVLLECLPPKQITRLGGTNPEFLEKMMAGCDASFLFAYTLMESGERSFSSCAFRGDERRVESLSLTPNR